MSAASLEAKDNAKGVSKNKRTFGEPEFRLFTEAQGRFVDLLPVKASGE